MKNWSNKKKEGKDLHTYRGISVCWEEEEKNFGRDVGGLHRGFCVLADEGKVGIIPLQLFHILCVLQE